MKILAVDDDPLTLRALRKVFGDLTITAVDIAEAKIVAGEAQPDVILLDAMLDSESGIEAIPDLLRLSPRSVVVVFTASSSGDLRKLALDAGAAACVHKIHIQRIDEIIDDVLASGPSRERARAALH